MEESRWWLKGAIATTKARAAKNATTKQILHLFPPVYRLGIQASESEYTHVHKKLCSYSAYLHMMFTNIWIFFEWEISEKNCNNKMA